MAVKVEIGFDLTESPIGPFFTLDGPVAGVLDNTDWTLAGTIFYDITEFVQSISSSRGKSRLLDKFQAGNLTVVLDNTGREFDPTYEASPFFGNIIPRREIRISVDGVFQFSGVVDDWNLDYEPQGKQTATIIASDGFTKLTNQTLSGGLQAVQQSGERVNAILSDPGVDWPLDKRDIDTGATEVGADTIEAGENALSYLQLVEQSEPGRLFMGKNGNIVFRDRTISPTTADTPLLADDGTGINFQIVSVEYGSELLFNEVNITSVITGGTATAIDADSQTNYGIITLNREGLLINNDAVAKQFAQFYANKYSEPEFRFRQVEVVLDELISEDKTKILNLELGDVVQIKFTPGAVGDAIDRFAEIIQIENNILPTRHVVRFGFATLDNAGLVLDDAVFGKLDSRNALAF